MKMHEHDQELIMALAEGRLAADAAAEAHAEIASCSECSADLDLQMAAIAILDDMPEVYMTVAESARLHTKLKRELSLETRPETAPARRSFAWSRLLPAAGVAAALLVVIISLPSLLGGGSDDSSDETIASPSFDVGATETTAAMEIPRDGMEEMAGGDNATAEAAPPAALQTTEAPEATTTTMAALSDDGSGGLLGTLSFLGPVDEVDTAALLDLIRSEDVDLAGDSEQAKNADPVLAGCLAESVTAEVAAIWGLPVDSSPVIMGTVVDDLGGELLLVAYVPENIADTVFATVTPGCAEILLLP